MATFKTLQAGSASHLRMTGQLAGAISGGLTVASVIVRMVHDMVRDAISDVIGKLASKVAIGVLTAGLAAPWAVSSAVTEVSSWVTRLSKEVADTVLSAKNLKGLLSKANRLLDDVAAAFNRIPAKVSEAVTTKVEAAKDLASSLRNPPVRTGRAAGHQHAPGRRHGESHTHRPQTQQSSHTPQDRTPQPQRRPLGSKTRRRPSQVRPQTNHRRRRRHPTQRWRRRKGRRRKRPNERPGRLLSSQKRNRSRDEGIPRLRRGL